MKGFVEMTEPDGGECVGVVIVVKAGTGLSRVFANRTASNLLNLSNHFWGRFHEASLGKDLL